MKISTLVKGNQTVISIDGDLDAGSSVLLDSAIEEAIAAGHRHLLVDCTRLNYISSAGLGVFMSRVQDFEDQHIRMVLFGLQAKVFRIFQILGLDQLLNIVASEAEAETLAHQ